MSKTLQTQVLIVGGGPAGYPCAIRAAQLGLDVTLVDADGLGGTCLNRGCIPSKALIHAAGRFEAIREQADEAAMGISCGAPKLDMQALTGWKDGLVDRLTGGVATLLKAAGVNVLPGWAVFSDAKHCTVTLKSGDKIAISAQDVVLATGSKEVELPFLPFDGKRVLSSTTALEATRLPKSLAVIGAGYIGLELGIAWAKLGVKVSFIEALDRILPLYDAQLVRPVLRWMKAHDVDVHLSCKAKGLTRAGLSYEDKEGTAHELKCDKVLVAVGRKPVTDGWGLETMGVDMAGPFIRIDDQCRTSMRGVYAIGDVSGAPMLAHRGTKQGEMVAEIIAGHKRRFDPAAIPAVCFTEPEIVSVGLTAIDAKARGEDVIIGKFPFAALGKALTMQAGTDGGFIRITARKSDHVILGIHAVGAHVAELSGEFSLALEMGARLEDIAGTIHVHPTLGEGFAESALAALGQPLHIAR